MLKLQPWPALTEPPNTTMLTGAPLRSFETSRSSRAVLPASPGGRSMSDALSGTSTAGPVMSSNAGGESHDGDDGESGDDVGGAKGSSFPSA